MGIMPAVIDKMILQLSLAGVVVVEDIQWHVQQDGWTYTPPTQLTPFMEEGLGTGGSALAGATVTCTEMQLCNHKLLSCKKL